MSQPTLDVQKSPLKHSTGPPINLHALSPRHRYFFKKVQQHVRETHQVHEEERISIVETLIDNGTICWPVIKDAETGIFLTLRLDAKVLDGGCQINRLDPPLPPLLSIWIPLGVLLLGWAVWRVGRMVGVWGRGGGVGRGGGRHYLIVRDCVRDIWLWG